ncbi:hypothetical protein Vc3S01_A0343 [Vibrio campbellii]|nr:hypothetical protein Vc3S01_A0343 [Vibrio campbellii]
MRILRAEYIINLGIDNSPHIAIQTSNCSVIANIPKRWKCYFYLTEGENIVRQIITQARSYH